MKDNKWIWIIGIVILLFFINQNDKKEALDALGNTGQGFAIKIQDYDNPGIAGEIVDVNVLVRDSVGKGGTMYLECGIYDKKFTEPEQWLDWPFTKGNADSFSSNAGAINVENTFENCVSGETNVWTRKITLQPNGETLVDLTPRAPTPQAGQEFVLYCEPFKKCASQCQGAADISTCIGVTDYGLQDIGISGKPSIAMNFETNRVEGIDINDISDSPASVIAKHLCDGENVLCETDSKCMTIKSLETKDIITGTQGDLLFKESKSIWEKYRDYWISGLTLGIYGRIKDWFDDDDKSKVGICVIESSAKGEICVGFADDIMKSVMKKSSCTTRTILFFVIIFALFMLIMGLSK